MKPYRGVFGQPRPADLVRVPLPPHPMPSHHQGRPLKAWRYIGVYGPEVMLCLGQARIGRARQSFWAVWDRLDRRLYERTTMGVGGVHFARGAAALTAPEVRLDLRLEEGSDIEVVCPAGRSYAWTRKQAPVPARLEIELDGAARALDVAAVVDDTAAYYPRHTHWRWSAGIGLANDGRSVAWNLVNGVNDPEVGSERTVWVDGQPHEVPECSFSEDLTCVGDLRFKPEAVREHRQNLLVVRTRYRQPFGTFSGELPGGISLAEGYGVTEEHEVWW